MALVLDGLVCIVSSMLFACSASFLMCCVYLSSTMPFDPSLKDSRSMIF